MKPQLFTEAKAEIVQGVSKDLLPHLIEILPTVIYFSINRVAGMLEISPDTAKRLFAGKIVSLGKRQLRVSMADVQAAAETYRKNKPRNAKKEAKP